MKKIFRKIKANFELTAIAVTFAEAGEWKIAESYLDQLKNLNESKKPKLMVIAMNSDFSQGTIDYTVNLADRMKFDVLAVNLLGARECKQISRSNREKEFCADSKDRFESLINSTKERSIQCECIIAADDIRLVIKKIRRLIKRIEILLVQIGAEQKFSLNLDIPVYQVASTDAGS